jgi:septum formation inhibitor-activating ATPase MinD
VQTNLQQSLDSEPKESRVIVVTSRGVGKTTATANIGMSIARLGYKVVVIDADIGLKISIIRLRESYFIYSNGRFEGSVA